MNILKHIYNHITTQYKIDNGQIGGIIAVFSTSLVILSPFSFIGILALNYDKYLKYWMSLEMFIIASITISILYEWIFFTIIYPSIMQFANRRAYMHDSPIQRDVAELKNTLNNVSLTQNNMKETLNKILSKR